MSGATRLSSDGNSNGADLADPAVMAGFVLRVDAELQRVIAEQARQGRMLDKICLALSIEPEKSDPPPAIRRTLESLQEEDARLRKADADSSQRIEAVSREVAETRLDVRFGLIKGIPRLYKALLAVAVAITAAVGLAAQVWEVVKHGW